MTSVWLDYGNATVRKNMVVLPYKCRMELASRYLHRLVMESLGKERDLNPKVTNQGLTVFVNKWSTDEHGYVQQLQEVPNDSVTKFIEVLHDGQDSQLMVEDKVTSGDFLHRFYQGTREALTEKDREFVTITLCNVTGHTAAKLIARFEGQSGFCFFRQHQPLPSTKCRTRKKQLRKLSTLKGKS